MQLRGRWNDSKIAKKRSLSKGVQVEPDRAREEEGRLWNDRHFRPKVMQAEISYVEAVDLDPAPAVP